MVVAAIGARGIQDEAETLVLVIGAFGVAALAIKGRETIEEQLRDVRRGDGIGAGEALAGNLLEEIVEEAIHRGGGGEIVDGVEKVVGDGIRVGRRPLGHDLGKMMSAEGRMVLGKEEAAAAAGGGDVLAMTGRMRLCGHGLAFRDGFGEAVK